MTEQRILIVDDHPLFRDALSTILNSMKFGQVSIQHAPDIKMAVYACKKENFDLVLLDLELGDASAFDGYLTLKPNLNGASVYIISATDNEKIIYKAKTLGIKGYLPKNLPNEKLSAALVTAIDGGEWFPDLPITLKTDIDNAQKIMSLTPAQQRVMNGLTNGQLNKQIAYDMGISVATVKAHMTAIMRKLGAHNRTQALLVYNQARSLTGSMLPNQSEQDSD